MRLATIAGGTQRSVALVENDGATFRPLAPSLAGKAAVLDMQTLIEGWESLRDRVAGAAGDAVARRAVRLEAPIPRPRRNVMCVGKNYREHAAEFGRSGFDSSAGSDAAAPPDVPIIFTKVPESVIADGAAIRYPEGVSDALDYEAELAVVIGREGRGIARERAYEHVFGYTIVNDVTARDWQQRHKQWFLGKSFDTFCPMGPWIVTADELDVSDLAVRCRVNGELRQDARTRDLIFDVPALIATISAGITLYPGDVIATGTPAGVGIGFRPPRYLARGDEIRIDIEGIGTLTNRVA
ncbi:MAG TPA: fumarylacetoacetate hydrolase family protein [Candidatus Baltobacteraceae bacterium]|nr:fumarylacetoacetate hydrolase family protein [Candidatus Baltobacteraceae bacterium]